MFGDRGFEAASGTANPCLLKGILVSLQSMPAERYICLAEPITPISLSRILANYGTAEKGDNA